MYIQTAEIENKVEPVLYDSKNKPLMVLPTTEDESGQRYMHVHYEIEKYLKRRAEGKPIYDGEVKRIFTLVDNYRKTGKWEPTRRDWTKSLEQLLEDNNYEEAVNSSTKIAKLKKYIKKNIPEPQRPKEPPRPTKVKRLLEPVEIKPPVLPKELLEKHRSI